MITPEQQAALEALPYRDPKVMYADELLAIHRILRTPRADSILVWTGGYFTGNRFKGTKLEEQKAYQTLSTAAREQAVVLEVLHGQYGR